MPLEPAISLGAKAPSMAESMQPIAAMLSMNGAMQQQQMQHAELQNYRQQQADRNALRSVFSNQENFNDGRPNIDRITPELFKAAPNSASGVLDQLQKGQTHGVELQQKQFDLAKARIGAMHGALSALAQKPDLNQTDVISVARQLVDAQMADPKGIATALQTMPADPNGLRQWINQGLMSVQTAKDQLEATTPKVQMQDTGGQIVPYNTNPRAGSVGPVAGGGALSKQMTPEQQFAATKPEWKDGAWVAPPAAGAVAPGGAFTPQGMAPPKGSQAEKAQKAGAILPMLDDAEALLKKATGSYSGAGYDLVARTFGMTTEGSRSIAQLKALEGALMMQMPRMEGPQSDRDVAMYKASAGNLGDPTIPAEQKLDAIKTIRQIQERYAGGASPGGSPMARKGSGASGSWGGAQNNSMEVKSLNDGGSFLEVDGAKYPVVARNADGSITVKDSKTGRTGTVRP